MLEDKRFWIHSLNFTNFVIKQ